MKTLPAVRVVWLDIIVQMPPYETKPWCDVCSDEIPPPHNPLRIFACFLSLRCAFRAVVIEKKLLETAPSLAKESGWGSAKKYGTALGKDNYRNDINEENRNTCPFLTTQHDDDNEQESKEERTKMNGKQHYDNRLPMANLWHYNPVLAYSL